MAAISNMVVKVHADHLGRGPTKARTYVNDNLVTCLLEDTLTRAERTLLDAGREAKVLELRAAVAEVMTAPLRAEMEQLCERPVQALINGSLLEPDVTSHVFVLGDGLDGFAEPPG